MNVTIRERNAVYIPDYTPTNPAWKIQLQDAHRLVIIAGTQCFVKRFERLLPAWNFLVANRGKRHTGLPLIYDAQSRIENGKTVYYLFLEAIQGELLHDVIRTGGTANGPTLGRSMAAAFRVLRAEGYWHADFCTKNIMVSTANKHFVLIDLDSLEPVTTFPTTARNQPGYMPDQELAVYALNYVKTYAQPTLKTFAAFPGTALNVIQLIFLLDKLVYFTVVLKPQGEKFGQKKNFENLPGIVYKHLDGYTSTLIRSILADKPVTDEMLLSQGSNLQAQLQAAPKPVMSVAPVVKPTPSPKPVSSVVSRPAAKLPSSPAAPVPRYSSAPSIGYLRASKTELKPGESTTISWGTTGSGSASLTYLSSIAPSGAQLLTYEQLARYSGRKEGRVELTLTVGTQGLKKTVVVELKLASPTTYLTTVSPIKPSLPVLANSTSSAANKTASKKGKADFRKKVFWVALTISIFVILKFLGVFSFNSAPKIVFTPNQQRGLVLFDQKKYDSSFIHLVNFRYDTSQNFATQYNLAVMYDFGEGTKVNSALAVKLYTESLNSKSTKIISNSMFYLGKCYSLGKGCKRDEKMARQLFTFAAREYNNNDARKELRNLRGVSNTSVINTIPKNALEAIALEPNVSSRSASAENVLIKRLVQFRNYTRVDFIYTVSESEESYVWLNSPGHPDAMYIKSEGVVYKLLKTSGISSRDKKTYAYAGKPLYFSAFFEKIPSSTTKTDIIEGEHGTWDFYGVEVSFEAQ